MIDGPYEMMTDGVTHEDAQYSREQNAYNFVATYYEMTTGAFRLIGGSMGLVTSALANGNVIIAPEDQEVTA